MNAKTLKALNESIKHWDRLANGTSANRESIYGESCSLCRMFARKNHSCAGCPVDAAGHIHCSDTPWRSAERAYLVNGKKSKEFKTAAAKQLEFLKSLLPK